MKACALKVERKIKQHNNPTVAGKYSLEVLFRASDNIPHHYPKLTYDFGILNIVLED